MISEWFLKIWLWSDNWDKSYLRNYKYVIISKPLPESMEHEKYEKQKLTSVSSYSILFVLYYSRPHGLSNKCTPAHTLTYTQWQHFRFPLWPHWCLGLITLDCAHGAFRVNLCNSPAISGVLKQFPVQQISGNGHDLMHMNMCMWVSVCVSVAEMFPWVLG